MLVRSGRLSGSSAPAATATARYTEYAPACVPITLRWALFVTVPIKGPRTIGSSAPHTIGTGCGPCVGCEGARMALGCFVGGMVDISRFPYKHDIHSNPRERPLAGDLFVAPESTPRARLSPWPNLESCSAERKRIARDGHTDVDATISLVALSATLRARTERRYECVAVFALAFERTPDPKCPTRTTDSPAEALGLGAAHVRLTPPSTVVPPLTAIVAGRWLGVASSASWHLRVRLRQAVTTFAPCASMRAPCLAGSSFAATSITLSITLALRPPRPSRRGLQRCRATLRVDDGLHRQRVVGVVSKP